MARLATEFEPGQLHRRIDIFGQGKHLEAAAEHFRVKKGMQGALRFRVGAFQQRGRFGYNSGQEMMLVGEAAELHTQLFGMLHQARPIHMSRDVRVTNIFEHRLHSSMSRTDLQSAVP